MFARNFLTNFSSIIPVRCLEYLLVSYQPLSLISPESWAVSFYVYLTRILPRICASWQLSSGSVFYFLYNWLYWNVKTTARLLAEPHRGPYCRLTEGLTTASQRALLPPHRPPYYRLMGPQRALLPPQRASHRGLLTNSPKRASHKGTLTEGLTTATKSLSQTPTIASQSLNAASYKASHGDFWHLIHKTLQPPSTQTYCHHTQKLIDTSHEAVQLPHIETYCRLKQILAAASQKIFLPPHTETNHRLTKRFTAASHKALLPPTRKFTAASHRDLLQPHTETYCHLIQSHTAASQRLTAAPHRLTVALHKALLPSHIVTYCRLTLRLTDAAHKG